MSKRIQSIKGVFGQIIHFKDGVKAGETWDGLIPGTKNHYNADGSFAGSSAPGFLADEVHCDQYGSRIGESWTNDFGTTRHYDESGRVGTSYDGIMGTTSHIADDGDILFDQSENDDLFTDDVPCGEPDW